MFAVLCLRVSVVYSSWWAMSRGISGGKLEIKFSNVGNRGRPCFNSHAKCAVWVSTKLTSLLLQCCDNFYGRYCIQKSKNGHFHPQFANIVFHIKSYSFSVVKNKQTRPRFLVLGNFITCWLPEKPRDISPWTRAKMAGIVSKVYYFSTGLTHNSNILVACEQALCLGKKNRFSLSLVPRSTKGLFTG